jgi:hypothetical protein
MKPPSGIMYRPPELAPAPELVLEPPPPELPPLQAPAWHVAPTAVQSSQAAPAVPQYVSPEFWQVPFVSQQPLQAWVPHVPVPPDPLLLYVPLEVPPSLPSPGLVVEPPQAPMAAREVTKMPAKMRVETLMIMSSPPKTACDRRPAPPDSATVPSGGTDQAAGCRLPLRRPFFWVLSGTRTRPRRRWERHPHPGPRSPGRSDRRPRRAGSPSCSGSLRSGRSWGHRIDSGGMEWRMCTRRTSRWPSRTRIPPGSVLVRRRIAEGRRTRRRSPGGHRSTVHRWAGNLRRSRRPERSQRSGCTRNRDPGKARPGVRTRRSAGKIDCSALSVAGTESP